jgi:hypothetical protein
VIPTPTAHRVVTTTLELKIIVGRLGHTTLRISDIDSWRKPRALVRARSTGLRWLHDGCPTQPVVGGDGGLGGRGGVRAPAGSGSTTPVSHLRDFNDQWPFPVWDYRVFDEAIQRGANSVIGLIFLLVVLVSLVIIVWALVSVATLSKEAFNQVGQSKTLWIVLLLVGLVVFPPIGGILGAVYLKTIRPKVLLGGG